MQGDRHCPLCFATAPWTFAAHGRDYHRCAHCELLFVRPDQLPSTQDCLDRYRLHRNDAADEGYLRFLAPALDALARHAGAGARVLDFGCGPGPALAGQLAARGFDVQRYDPLFHPEQPEGRFDAVVATEVFEHFHEPARDCARALGLLAPRGRLIVMTLLTRPGLDVASWWYLRDLTHVAFYSRRTFEVLVAAYGLDLLETDGDRLLVLGRS